MEKTGDSKILIDPPRDRSQQWSAGKIIFSAVAVTFLMVLGIFLGWQIRSNYDHRHTILKGTREYDVSIHFNREPSKQYEYETRVTEYVGRKTVRQVATESQEPKQCDVISDNYRFDCHPESDSDQSKCEARGCCWAPPKKPYKPTSKNSLGVPYCYYPKNYAGYYLVNQTKTHRGYELYIARNSSSYYGNDIKLLKVDIELGRTRIRQKIYDPINKRYEVPYPLRPEEGHDFSAISNYDVQFTNYPFAIKIVHKPTLRTMHNSNFGALIYTDQFIQFSGAIPKYVYGLGERKDNFQRSLDWQQFLMFAADQAPRESSNLYGSHPFMLVSEGPIGNKRSPFVGVLVYNSNAMEAILQPTPAVTFRALGGILDIVTFIGPSAEEVISQYTAAIGRPIMPPYWSLGFHLCRWGYSSANKTREIWQRNRDAKIPFDVQWNDIDYMDKYRDFTYDKKKFAQLPQLVDDIHKAGMHYIPIIDPAMDTPADPSSYPPYEDGLKRGIYVNGSDGKPLRGKVWSLNGAVWPDFTNPATTDFWTKQLSDYNKQIPIDGIWIDMNEPSNFFDGSQTGCPDSKYEKPPYVPSINGGKLITKTLCMSGNQHAGIHYDVHNLYGYSETIATNKALKSIRPGKRPFIISRSTFPGQGHYGSHWTGDVFSTWDDLQKSIPDILDFNLFGIPMVGADICGFNGNTTSELCKRWMQLGAFYPFSRNHNTIGAIDQDPANPAFGNEVLIPSRTALSIRYMFLPYLYTLFYRAHVHGNTVARPLFFEFPDDIKTYAIDRQFLLGPAFMVIPLLEEKATNITAYIPSGRWYTTANPPILISKGQEITFTPNKDTIPLAFRGGHILPIKEYPSLTTTDSRTRPFEIFSVLDERGRAEGELYWDDGESLDTIEKGNYNLIEFFIDHKAFYSRPIKAGAKGEMMTTDGLLVFGLESKPTIVKINGYKTYNFAYDAVQKSLSVALQMSLLDPITVTWN